MVVVDLGTDYYSNNCGKISNWVESGLVGPQGQNTAQIRVGVGRVHLAPLIQIPSSSLCFISLKFHNQSHFSLIHNILIVKKKKKGKNNLPGPH